MNRQHKNTALKARDLSESLGKLPPSALDMEEAVLGAIMLERDAMDLVQKFLRPEHFYKEAHQYVYRAAISLKSAGDPIDMRTVRASLTKSGHLELVGGAFYLANLTSNVSGSSNIEAHARVIVEMSVLRSLIQAASQIHHDAYEGDTDCFALLEKSLTGLTELKNTSVLRSIKTLWAETMVTDEPPDNPPLISINDSPVATAGNHSLLVGKKKSRKTLYVVWLLSQYLRHNPDKFNSVLLFDTEQGRKHVYKLRQKLHLMTGSLVPVFYLRGQSPKERRDFIQQTVQQWPSKPTVLVIDGIRDLMSNINDPDETTEVIVWLEKLTLQHNVHVINVLHLNKTDGNARGHIGSELLNKAEVTTELERDEKTGTTVVKCESSREKPFDQFAFTHGDNDLPVIVGVPLNEGALPADEKVSRLRTVFEEGNLKYNDAIELIKVNFACGQNKAGHLLAEFVRNGWVMKSGAQRSPNTTYRIMLTASGAPLTPLPRPSEPNTPADQIDLPF